jgi:hypothetical protein
VSPDQHIRKSDNFLREIYRRLPAKADSFSGLGFVYLSFACGSMLLAIEEFRVPKQIETFLRSSRHCPWRLDLETGYKAR